MRFGFTIAAALVGGGCHSTNPNRADAQNDADAQADSARADAPRDVGPDALDAASCTVCGANCVDTASNDMHCGSCEHSCLGGMCVAGTCQPVILAAGEATPTALIVDATHVYWSTRAGEIKKVLKTGGSVTPLVSGLSDAPGIDVDANALYWNTLGANAQIMTAGLDGSAPTPIATGQNDPSALVVSAGYVYWAVIATSAYEIYRSPTTGGMPAFVSQNPTFNIYDLIVDASSIYWTDPSSVKKAALPSGAPTVLASAQPQPIGIAINATNVYWGTANTTVATVLITGGTPTTLATAQQSPWAVAVDDQFVYWANINGGQVRKVSLAGGTPVTLATGQASPGQIRVDDVAVYWVNHGATVSSGSVMKLAK